MKFVGGTHVFHEIDPRFLITNPLDGIANSFLPIFLFKNSEWIIC
jgi:hypothetical protein